MKISNKVINMTQFSILLAIEALFCFTPLGSLPALGPIVATLMMVPVIITAILMGVKYATAIGFISGLFSFLVWTFTPPSPLTAFLFTPFYSLGEFQGNFGSILICFVPRILTGTFAALLYKALSKPLRDKEVLKMSISAIIGSMTNTLLVMLGIWIFFGTQYSSLAGQSILIIIASTIITSGIPEALIAAAATSVVCKPLKIVISKRIK